MGNEQPARTRGHTFHGRAFTLAPSDCGLAVPPRAYPPLDNSTRILPQVHLPRGQESSTESGTIYEDFKH